MGPRSVKLCPLFDDRRPMTAKGPRGEVGNGSQRGEPARGANPEEGGNWLACDREKRAAPSAPRSGPPAATLTGGLRPGSLRVHDLCKEARHGSRLGVPGRRPPRGPAAPGNVARALQVLPKQARRVPSEGRGEMGLDPAEPGLRPAGVPPPERSAGGGGRPAAPRSARRGSTVCRQINPWNCSAGEAPLLEPSRTELPERPGARGRGRCCSRSRNPRNFPPTKDASRAGEFPNGKTGMVVIDTMRPRP